MVSFERSQLKWLWIVGAAMLLSALAVACGSAEEPVGANANGDASGRAHAVARRCAARADRPYARARRAGRRYGHARGPAGDPHAGRRDDDAGTW